VTGPGSLSSSSSGESTDPSQIQWDGGQFDGVQLQLTSHHSFVSPAHLPTERHVPGMTGSTSSSGVGLGGVGLGGVGPGGVGPGRVGLGSVSPPSPTICSKK